MFEIYVILKTIINLEYTKRTHPQLSESLSETSSYLYKLFFFYLIIHIAALCVAVKGDHENKLKHVAIALLLPAPYLMNKLFWCPYVCGGILS